MKIKVIIWQEEEVWCASVPALSACHTWGESYEHLMEMVKEAVEEWLEQKAKAVNGALFLKYMNLVALSKYIKEKLPFS